MLNTLFRFKKEKYRSFEEVVQGKKLKFSSYKGIMPINVNKIAGTVGRSQQLSSSLINRKSRRYKKIKQCMERLVHMPPIKVYSVDNNYYIVDGHHRVEASKEIGKVFLDAEVIEFNYH